MVERAERSQEAERKHLVPPVDIYENGQAVIVLADMPAVRPENLHVHIEQGTLTISGKQDDLPDRGEVVMQEFQVGEFTRRFTVGEDIDLSKVTAEFSDGVLRLTLPKEPERRARKITVRKA